MMLLLHIVVCLTLVCQPFVSLPIETKPKLTFDEFFNYISFPYLSFSPTAQHLLYQTRRASANDTDYNDSLYLYTIQTQQTLLITNRLYPYMRPQWSPSGHYIAMLLKRESPTDTLDKSDEKNGSASDQAHSFGHHIYLYSIQSSTFRAIPIGDSVPDVLAWSHNDSFFYFAENRRLSTTDVQGKASDHSTQKQDSEMTRIYHVRLNIEHETLWHKIDLIRNISFPVLEFLFVPIVDKLGEIFITVKSTHLT